MLVATVSRKREKAPLVTSGVYLAMVTCTVAEVAMAPRLSEATAVTVCKPSAKPNAPIETLYGLVVRLPSDTSPSKNWTFVTLPSGSLAEAWMFMVSVLPKLELSGGLVMVTLGGTFATLTVTLTTVEVVERPALSVRSEERAWLPVARLAVTMDGPPRVAA